MSIALVIEVNFMQSQIRMVQGTGARPRTNTLPTYNVTESLLDLQRIIAN